VAAEENIDRVLHKICQRAWEQEVDKKRTSHSIGCVFSMSTNMYFIEKDARAEGGTLQQDVGSDQEPVSAT
jgi:hypothetical protein